MKEDDFSLPSSALALWVAVPCAVLAAIALGGRASANWPDPPQAWAAASVLWSQTLLAGFIFRRVCATWSSVSSALSLALPPVVAATSLAQLAPSAAVVPLLWLAAWLLALHVLARGRASTLLPPLLGLLPAGVAVLAYLHIEADPAAVGVGPSIFLPPLPLADGASTPLPWAVRLAPFALPAAVASAGAAARLLRRPPHARADHKLSTKIRAVVGKGLTTADRP